VVVVAEGTVDDVELLVLLVSSIVVVLVDVELLEAGSSSELDPPPQPATRAQANATTRHAIRSRVVVIY
jgi:hypothetical protein